MFLFREMFIELFTGVGNNWESEWKVRRKSSIFLAWGKESSSVGSVNMSTCENRMMTCADVSYYRMYSTSISPSTYTMNMLVVILHYCIDRVKWNKNNLQWNSSCIHSTICVRVFVTMTQKATTLMHCESTEYDFIIRSVLALCLYLNHAIFCSICVSTNPDCMCNIVRLLFSCAQLWAEYIIKSVNRLFYLIETIYIFRVIKLEWIYNFFQKNCRRVKCQTCFKLINGIIDEW